MTGCSLPQAHKRRGKSAAADQWVTLTLGDLLALLAGNRDHLTELPNN